MSQFPLVKAIIQNKGVIHVPEMQCFLVKGTKDARYAVQLFSKQTCRCPSTSQCYHIVAAKMSIGMSQGIPDEKVNLAQLGRNSRKRLGKKFGNKQPRKFD